MANGFDIPQCLQHLMTTGRIKASDDWGNCANTNDIYPDFAAGWLGKSAVPTLAEMDAAWTALQPTVQAQAKSRQTAAVPTDSATLQALCALVDALRLAQQPPVIAKMPAWAVAIVQPVANAAAVVQASAVVPPVV